MVTSSAPSNLDLDRRIDGGHAAADDDHLAADGQFCRIICLAQICDEFDRIQDAFQVLACRYRGR